MEKRIDFNSSVNQDIKSRFVEIHVHACVSGMITELITAYDGGSIGFDPYEHMTFHGYFEGDKITEEEKDEKVTEIEDKIDIVENISAVYETEYDILDEKDISEDNYKMQYYISKITTGIALVDKLNEAIEALEEISFDEPPEIFEYWIVSNFLGEKLKALGHTIIEEYGHSIWGRETSGQAILLDYAISEICSSMKILDGQAHSWKKEN